MSVESNLEKQGGLVKVGPGLYELKDKEPSKGAQIAARALDRYLQIQDDLLCEINPIHLIRRLRKERGANK